MKNIFRKRPYLNIIGHKYVWFAISVVIVIVAAIALFTRGLDWGIDFTGGTELDVRMKPGTSIADVRSAIGKLGYSTAQIQSSGKDTFIIRVPKLDDAKKKALEEGLKADGMEEVLGVNDVGPGWGAQVSRQAVIAVIVFLLAILIYISFRFEFKMAITAIIEVFHDLVITVGVYALVGWVVTPATVIAVLTILGYSLYDSIVIFDRVKENADQLTRQSKKTYSQMVNDSVNQVLVRSINTSVTTLIPILCIMFFGGETLKNFAFALFLGVLSGSYSSEFLGPPILATWKETEPKYKAFRERAEVREGRERRVAIQAPKAKPVTTSAAKPAGPAASQAGKARAARPSAGKPAGAKAPPKPGPKPKPAAEPIEREAGTAAEAESAEPGPKPKPRPKPASAKPPTSKAQAKSRTKGPGSGKKKKKKR
ncbi:MAG: protein translocase subunit SecF [Actinobacteria bacterium]|nr:protein translocase subunit SecF [Actinomycetota bacterium]MBU1942284.1 protein translocase subunit SecF [Actinomycetota bacterium]MBU2687367.1 protein translocase subunit SecF [Actinomycetota bacterium]